MTAADVPAGDLEMTAAIVRIMRRADDDARAADVAARCMADHPHADEETVRRCMSHAARLYADEDR
jgi:hypothetical protein